MSECATVEFASHEIILTPDLHQHVPASDVCEPQLRAGYNLACLDRTGDYGDKTASLRAANQQRIGARPQENILSGGQSAFAYNEVKGNGGGDFLIVVLCVGGGYQDNKDQCSCDAIR